MSMRSWIRNVFARPVTRPIRKEQPKSRLGVESLEERLAPAGGLLSQLISDKIVQIQADAGETITLEATPAGAQQLTRFFGAADGSAGTATFDGSLTAGGEVVSGSFVLTEFGPATGVQVLVANASISLGGTAGVELTAADGAFALLATGAAGVLNAADGPAGTEVSVFGLAGLNLVSTGMEYRLNTTGQAIDRTVATPGGPVAISFSDGTAVEQLEGLAEFFVDGASAHVVRVAGAFEMTEAGDGLALAGEQVGVDLYASSSTRAVTLGSAEADFTLTEDAFELVDDSFIVGGFDFLQTGNPIPPGQGNYAPSQVTHSASLGPVAFAQVGLVLDGLTFGPNGLAVDVGVSAASASLTFAAATAEATGLLGTFEIAGDVDQTTGAVSGFSASGKFAIRADTFDVEVPGLITASAEGLMIQYNPGASGPQELISADKVMVEVPPLKLLGEFDSTDAFPALQIRTDGFAFGKGTVTYVGTVSFGSAVSITNPFVSLENFNFSTTTGLRVDGFSVGAGEITVTAGSFTGIGTDLEVKIGLDASSTKVEKVEFTVGQLIATGGSKNGSPAPITLTATDLAFTPTATGSETIFSVTEASASVFVAGIRLTGTAGATSIAADGSFEGPQTLRISVDFTLESDEYNAQTARQFMWPAWLPVKLREVAVDWRDFAANPTNFAIEISAGIDGTIGPLTVQGGVDKMVLDPYRLLEGKNPLVSLQGFGVKVGGNLFGAQIEGALVGGILILDAETNIIEEIPANAPYSTVFYAGLNGKIEFAGVGLEILIGFSERGLLQAYFSAGVPVLLEPFSGLTMSDFRGGITFNATPLETPDSPTGLLAPEFLPTLELTVDQWQQQLKQAVANQVSGGSRIFILDTGVAAAVDELESGEVEVGGVLHAAFEDNGYAVADAVEPGAVTELVPDEQWLVTYAGASYVLERNGGVIDVTQAEFIVPATTAPAVITALGTTQAPVQQAVIDAFLAADVMLTTNAMVEVVESSGGVPVKWKIVDGDVPAYFVTARGNVLAVTGGGGYYDDLDKVIKIEAGATLYSAYITEQAFNADIDVIITTDGKFLILAQAVLAETISADLRLFGDLSAIDDETPDGPLTMLFLGDFPSARTGLPQLARIQGKATFQVEDLLGNIINPIFNPELAKVFRLDVQGRAEVGVLGYATLVFAGDAGVDGGFANMTLTVENRDDATRVQVDASGSLSIEGILKAEDVVSAAGSLIFEKTTNGPLEVYGAAKLDFDSANLPSFLKNAGLTVDAQLVLAFNSSTTTRDVTLALPGREEEEFHLAPVTLIVEGEGTLRLSKQLYGFGPDVAFDGAFSARISVDVTDEAGNPDPTIRGDNGVDLDVFVAGKLDVGLSALDQRFSLLSLDGLGFLAIRDIGAVVNGNPIAPSIAGRVDLIVAAGLPGVIELTGSVQMLLNSTGQEFTYVIPERLQERLKAIQARRLNIPSGSVSLPPLPAIIDPRTSNQYLVVTVPARPPALLSGEPFPAGPYFFLQFGDPNETPTSGNPDPDGDGLLDVSLTILNTFRLTGDFRILAAAQGFEMAANAVASIVLPGAGSILEAPATGLLRITNDGVIGALSLQTQFAIPGVSFKANAYLGINTTDQDAPLNFGDPKVTNRTILARSTEIDLGGSLMVGPLELKGQFRLLVGAGAIRVEADASFEFFDVAALKVKGMATVFYGRPAGQNGLVLDASVSVGGDGSFGVPGIFEVGGQLRLKLDTRAQQERFELSLTNAHVTLLGALSFGGSARVVIERDDPRADPYFRIEGNFLGNFLDVITVSVAGFFDSRGFFGVDVRGQFQLGSDDFGLRVQGQFFIERSEEVPLDFGGSISAEARAFGFTVFGIGAFLDYEGYGVNDPRPVTGRISVGASVDIGPLIHVDFGPYTVGYLLLDPMQAPELGHREGNTLRLHVGPDASLRALRPGEINEAYTIESIGPGTNTGEKIRVRAFGSTQLFDDVTSITGDFGTGADQVTVLPRVGTFRPVAVNLSGGVGNDMLINQSPRGVTFDAGAGNDMLLGGAGDDVLTGGAGNDTLDGGAGIDELRGGDNDDVLFWQAGLGADRVLDGGLGADVLMVNGSAAAEQFTVGASGSLMSIAVSGPVSQAVAASAEKLQINSQGGADSATVSTAIAGVGTTSVELNLTSVTHKLSSGAIIGQSDDGASDLATVVGTTAGETIAATANGSDVRVTSGGLTITLLNPLASTDSLTVRGGDGNDTLTTTRAASNLVKQVSLLGEGGDDTIRTPIGAALVQGGTGANTAIYTVDAGDSTDVTILPDRVTSDDGSIGYTGLAEVAVESSVPASVTVQNTATNRTRLGLAANSTVDVLKTSGPVAVAVGTGSTIYVEATGGTTDVTLGGNSALTLGSTGGATTVTGTAGGGGRVELGVGLLSRIGGNVSVSNVDGIIYNDAADGIARTFALTGSALTGGPNTGTLTHTNARKIDLHLGYADDVVNATVSRAAVTVTGNGGTDRANVTLSGSPAAVNPFDASKFAVTAAGFESATFTTTGNTASTDWTLDANRISTLSTKLFDAGTVGRLDVTTSQGTPSTFTVGRVPVTTSVTFGGTGNILYVGGPLPDGTLTTTLDDVDGNLTLTGSGGTALEFDDRGSLESDVGRQRRFDDTTVTDPRGRQASTIRYSGFDTVEAGFGKATDLVTLDGATRLVRAHGGDGDDTFIVKGTFATVQVAGEAGNDTVTLQPGSGTVRFLGGADADTVTFDRSDAVTSVTAVVDAPAGATNATATLTGLPSLLLPTANPDTERLVFSLGAGNDSFNTNGETNVSLNTQILVYGNEGDDDLRINDLLPDPARYQLIGGFIGGVKDDGFDVVTLVVRGVPLARPAGDLGVSTDDLIIDNSANTAGAVGWDVIGDTVRANGFDLLATTGATRVSILGGTVTGTDLTVTNKLPNRTIDATITGPTLPGLDGRIEFAEGFSVANQAGGPINGFSTVNAVAGLDGVSTVAAAPNGLFAYAAGTEGRIVSLQRGPTGFAFLAANPSLPVPADTNPGPLSSNSGYAISHLAISTDGRNLYSIEKQLSDGSFIAAARVLDPTTGAVTTPSVTSALVPLTNPNIPLELQLAPIDVQVDPADDFVVLVTPLPHGFGQTGFQVTTLPRSVGAAAFGSGMVGQFEFVANSDGSQTVDPLAFAFDAAGSQLSVTLTNGSIVLLNRDVTTGALTLRGAIASNPGITVGRGTQIQASDDGKLLFAFSAGTGAAGTGTLHYYTLATVNGVASPVRQLGSIQTTLDSPTAGNRGNVFHYVSATGVLVLLDGTSISTFRQDSSGIFQPVTSRAFGDQVSLEVDDAGTGTSYAVAKSLDVNGDLSRFTRYQVASDGSLSFIDSTRLASDLGASDLIRSDPVVVQSDSSTTAVVFQQQLFDSSGTEIGNQLIAAIGLSDLAPMALTLPAGTLVFDVQRGVHPNQVFTLERVASNLSLKSYLVDSTGITLVQTYPFNLFISDLRRLSVAPDGNLLYAIKGDGTSLSSFLLVDDAGGTRSVIQTTGGSGPTTTGGFQLGGVAFVANRMLAIASDRDELEEFPLPQSGSSLTGVNTYATGHNAFSLGSPTGIAYGTGSALYVAAGTKVLELTLLADGSDGVVTGSDDGGPYIQFRRVGANLYGLARTSSAGLLTQFTTSGGLHFVNDYAVSADAVGFGFADPAGDGNDFVAVVSDVAAGADKIEVYNADFSTGAIDSNASVVSQGDSIAAVKVKTLTTTAVSESGGYFYGVSAVNGTLVASAADGTSRDVILDGVSPRVDYLAAAALVAVTQDLQVGDVIHYVAVGSRTDKAVTLFQRRQDGTLQFVKTYVDPQFANLTDLAWSRADGAFTALLGTSQHFKIDPNSGTADLLDAFSNDPAKNSNLAPNPSLIQFNTSAGHSADRWMYSASDRVLSYDFSALAFEPLYQRFDNVQSVIDLAFGRAAGGRDSVYTLSNDGTIAQYSPANAVPGQFYGAGTVELTGLTGASAIEVSEDGTVLFVSNKDEGTVTVYARDAMTGKLEFAQVIREGRGGVFGLTSPIELAVRGTRLIVSSGGQSTGLDSAGFVVFELATGTPEELIPTQLATEFNRMQTVGLTTQNGDDTVRLAQAPGGSVQMLTIDTGNGADSVNVESALTGAGTTTNVLTGAGADTVTVDRTDSGGTLSVVTGTQADTVYLRKVGSGTTTVNTSGDPAVPDLIFATGSGVPSGTSVSVTGELRVVSGGDVTAVGDALVYDTTGGTFNGTTGTSGTLSLSGFGSVAFNGFNNGSDPAIQQVFPDAAPRPQITSSLTISEGGSLTLSAIDTAGVGGAIEFEYDLNGDGVFGDARTDNQGNNSTTVSWAALKSLGIDDDGTYRIAVRGSKVLALAQFGGRDLYLSGDATATLTANNTAPTLTLTGAGTAKLGATYAVAFSTSDPGDDRVTGWLINWGDGTPALALGSTAPGATHVYTVPGDYVVMLTATDEDGSYSTTRTVQVRPGAESISANGPYAIDEGTGLTATATAFGSPERYEWDLRNDGTIDVTTTTPTLTRTWAELNAAGITDSGNFTLTVTGVYVNGGEFRGTSPAATLTVANVAPSGTLTATPDSVPAASPTGAVMLALTDLSDPADPVSGLLIDYDFDNNGSIDLPNQPASQAVSVPAARLATPGQVTVRAVLRDDDGGSRELFVTFTVDEVPVTFDLTQTGPIVEGGSVSLTTTITSVGSLPVTEWVIEWGDGAVDTVAPNGTGTQTFSHPYADGDATYPVTVIARTATAQTPADTSVVASDVAPTVTLSTTTPTVTEGVANAFALKVAVNDPGADVVSGYTVDWGDGTTQDVSGDVLELTHTYADAPAGGTYSIELTSVANEDGDFALPSNVLTVTVANAPPILVTNPLPAGSYTLDFGASPIGVSVPQGNPSALELSEATLDVLGAGVTATWTIAPPVGAVFDLTGKTVTFTPTAGDGLYQVSLSATSANGTVTATADLTLANGAATLSNGTAVANVNSTAASLAARSSTLDVTFPVAIGTLDVGQIARVNGPGGVVGAPIAAAAVNPDGTGMATTWRLTFPSPFVVPAIGTENVAIDLSAVAGSLASGYEPLTFAWTITAPDGSTTSTTTTVAPVGISSLVVSKDEIDPSALVLSASTLEALGAGVTATWTIAPPTGAPLVLEGEVVSFIPTGDGLYQVSLSATSANGTATATADLTLANGEEPALSNVTGIGGVFQSDPLGFQYAASNGVTFTPADNGTYTVTLTVTDDDGTTTTVSREVLVQNVDPTVETFVVPSSANEGETVELQATATDPSDPRTFTWVVTERLTGWSTTLTGPIVSLTPPAGDYSVVLTVSDGDGGEDSQAAELTVVNLPPVVDQDSYQVPTSAVEGETTTFSVMATDTAAGLTYVWRIEGPTGAVTTITGAEVSYQYPDEGTYKVSVTVTDAGGAAVTVGPTLVVVTNVAPTIASANAPPTGTEGQALTLTGSATEPAGTFDPTQFRWFLTGPGGQVFATEGATASFTPPDDGDYAVVLQVSDRDGGVASQSVGTIAVANANPTVGVIVLPTGPISEGATVTLSVPPATDVAADVAGLTYTWTITPPTGAPLVLGGRQIQFVVPDDGTYAVRLVVTDGDGGSAEQTATLTVGNLDPVFQSFTVPAQGYVGFAVPLSAAFADVTADVPLSYTWTITQPGGGTTVLSGASVAFTPSVAGAHAVDLVVTDGDGGSATRTASFAVATSTLTLAPLDLPEMAEEATPLTLLADASDALGATITYTWQVTAPAGQTFALTGAMPTFTPPDDGTYLVTLTAQSANGVATGTGSFDVQNLPPVLTDLQIPLRVGFEVPVSLSATAIDPAGAADPLTYTWTITRPDLTTFTLDGPSVGFTPSEQGFYAVKLVVEDGDGGMVAASRTMAVANTPPVAAAGGPYDVVEAGTVQLDGLTGTSDANESSDALTYEWDFDGDGVFGEATTALGDERGPTPTFLAPLDGPVDVPIQLRVTDADGAASIADAVVRVANVAPVLDTLSLTVTTIDENGVVTLTGTYSDVGTPDTHTLTINWGDDDGEPQTVTVSGGAFSVTHRYLDDDPTDTPSDDYAIAVTLSDDDDGTAAGSVTARVSNVAPVLADLTNSSDDGSAFMGVDAVAIAATFTDVGTLDTHEASIDWGDGVVTAGTVSGANGTGTVSGSHVYATGGFFTITVTLTDDDGGQSQLETTTAIGGVGLNDGELQIIGTELRDLIYVGRLEATHTIRVDAGFGLPVDRSGDDAPLTFTFDSRVVESIVILGLGGNDYPYVNPDVRVPVEGDVVSATDDLVVGTGPGTTGGQMQILDGQTGQELHSFLIFEDFQGAVAVSHGDVNGDGTDDFIVGAGEGGMGAVKVFDGRTSQLLRSFLSFEGFNGAINVASGDVNGDGHDDVIVGAGAGSTGGHVKAFDGKTGELILSFFAFEGFAGGVSVAAGDLDGDGDDDVIVGAGAGSTGGHVKAFDGKTGELILSFFAFEGFAGAVSVATGDLDGDGDDDLVVGAGAGAMGGHVKTFDGSTLALLRSFLAFEGFAGGVRVTTGDVNGDAIADVIVGTGPADAGGHVKAFDAGEALLESFVGVAGNDSVTAGGIAEFEYDSSTASAATFANGKGAKKKRTTGVVALGSDTPVKPRVVKKFIGPIQVIRNPTAVGPDATPLPGPERPPQEAPPGG